MSNQRERLLSCTLQRVRVKLPEWKLDLYVQEMNASQREEYYSILVTSVSNSKPKENVAARILLPSLLDLEGKRLFSDDEAAKLEELSPQVITKLTNTLLQISGLTQDFYEAEKKRLNRQKNISFFSFWLKGWASHLQK
jgi:hypothetical protein